MDVLAATGLSASYGAGPVLTDVSFTVAEGTVIGIVGPNGHGKTTLLRAISGLLPRQSGEIRFKGDLISGLAPETIAARGIVHVPQGDLVYKNMSVVENLLVGGHTNTSATETSNRLEMAYTLFPKLKERASQVASSLSGGERRMLGIGRGLMMARAKLLMLDEPSLGLAPIIIDQIYQSIANLKSSGLSIVIVEENIGRVSTIADRLSLLSRGAIVWSGAPADALDNRQLLETYLGA